VTREEQPAHQHLHFCVLRDLAASEGHYGASGVAHLVPKEDVYIFDVTADGPRTIEIE
jgi:hypothetical protein